MYTLEMIENGQWCVFENPHDQYSAPRWFFNPAPTQSLAIVEARRYIPPERSMEFEAAMVREQCLLAGNPTCQ